MTSDGRVLDAARVADHLAIQDLATAYAYAVDDKDWVRWEARPWLNAAGEIGGMLAYVDDISAVASARREAQTNARRLKVALAAADAGVYEIDHVNKTFWASPEFKKLIGRSSRSYKDAQKLHFPKFHPDDMAGVRQAFLDINANRRKSGEAFEARIVTPSGEARWMRVFHHLKRDAKGRWIRCAPNTRRAGCRRD